MQEGVALTADDHMETLVLDGSHGEGGGQILRTAVSLAALTGRPLRIERIRAGRQNPGLAAQHLTAIRAAAEICGARLVGDTLGSGVLEFHPGGPPRPGRYNFDVARAREGGSAGAATLVLQTVALPLALAPGQSDVIVSGGTHVPWSPSFDYLDQVFLETLRRQGLDARAELGSWGFYPAGGGRIELSVGRGPGTGPVSVSPLSLEERGDLARIDGRAVAANLPSHIAQRMADRAEARLRPLGVPTSIRAMRVRSVSPGAWIFLKASYQAAVAGFGAHGRRGKPSEEVAEEAVSALLDHQGRSGAVDRYLADQILLPLVLAEAPSVFTSALVTAHLETNGWAIEQFGVARIDIARRPDGSGEVTVIPAGTRARPPA